MARIDWIGRPVIPGPWTRSLETVVADELSLVMKVNETTSPHQPALTRAETKRLPEVDVKRYKSLQFGLKLLRAMQPPDSLNVDTTKIVIRKPGVIFLGLSETDQLAEDRLTAHAMLEDTYGIPTRTDSRPVLGNILLGYTTDPTPEASSLILGTLIDRVMPTQVRLGQTAAQLVLETPRGVVRHLL